MFKLIKNFFKIFGTHYHKKESDFKDNKISRQKLEDALDFMISLEPDPCSANSWELYQDNINKHKKEIEKAKKIIQQYGQQIEPKTLSEMQQHYYSITNSEKYLQSALHCSVVRTLLNTEWHNIGPWQR